MSLRLVDLISPMLIFSRSIKIQEKEIYLCDLVRLKTNKQTLQSSRKFKD